MPTFKTNPRLGFDMIPTSKPPETNNVNWKSVAERLFEEAKVSKNQNENYKGILCDCHTVHDHLKETEKEFTTVNHVAVVLNAALRAVDEDTKPNPLLSLIKEIESSHFRTVSDLGSNFNAMAIWNIVRGHAGLPSISMEDLPSWNGVRYVMPKDSKLLSNLQK